MSYEQMQFSVDASGRQGSLQSTILSALYTQIRTDVGLNQGDVKIIGTTYAVTVKDPKKKLQLKQHAHKGSSTVSIDDAIKTASGGKEIDTEDISVHLTAEVDVPYFLQNIEGRGKNEEGAYAAMKARFEALSNSFGKALAEKPASTEYRVYRTQANYHTMAVIPKPSSKQVIGVVGYSPKNFHEAEAKAQPLSKRVVTTVYEAVYQYKIYGITQEHARTGVLGLPEPTARPKAAPPEKPVKEELPIAAQPKGDKKPAAIPPPEKKEPTRTTPSPRREEPRRPERQERRTYVPPPPSRIYRGGSPGEALPDLGPTVIEDF